MLGLLQKIGPDFRELAFLFRRGWYHRQGGSGEAVLGERYARGEITEEEYRRRRAVLRERSR